MVDPKFWGGDAWSFIHSLQINFDQRFLANYIDILQLLTAILPCQKCRANFEVDLQNIPTSTIKDEQSFIEWALKIHSAGNVALGRPPITSYNAEIAHKRIANFLQIAYDEIVIDDNQDRLDALHMFRDALRPIFPCLQCREIFTGTNMLLRDMIAVMNAHV